MPKQFILIMTDTTRKDMLGCYGNERMHTPFLDRLASGGIRYENAYTCQPVCGPARSAIFTGTFPHSNGVVTNCVPMGANVKTIGQRLTDQGIHCGYIGKWHLDGGDYFGLGVCPEGWDPEYWYDMKCYLNELSDEDKLRSRKPETAYDPSWTEEYTYAHRVAERARDFIARYRDEDFFLTVSLDEPHGPSICPPPYNHMYDGFRFDDSPVFHDTLENKPFYEKLWSGRRRFLSAEEVNAPSEELSRFLGCNSYADYEIGRVLEKIDELLPDATVVYTSDHGDMLGAHRLMNKDATSYKECANIPLIIRSPLIPEAYNGEKLDHPASHIDLAPTILDFMDLPVPRLLEGKSMLPQLRDPSVRINDVVYTEFTRYEIDHDGFGGLQMMRAAVSQRYKLQVNLLDTDEFYDLEADPYEVENRIGDPACAAERDRLHDALLAHMNETRDLYRGYQWAARPWRTDLAPVWENDGFTRQRENEEYEPRQLDYDTGMPMESAVRNKKLEKKIL